MSSPRSKDANRKTIRMWATNRAQAGPLDPKTNANASSCCWLTPKQLLPRVHLQAASHGSAALAPADTGVEKPDTTPVWLAPAVCPPVRRPSAGRPWRPGSPGKIRAHAAAPCPCTAQQEGCGPSRVGRTGAGVDCASLYSCRSVQMAAAAQQPAQQLPRSGPGAHR